MTIRCIIVDDEPLASEGIKRYVQKIDFLEIHGVFDSAVKANEFLLSNKIDLVFSDIQMPLLSGIEWVKNMSGRPLVIFTTAHPNYAIESFEVEAVDYLLKPISFERFFNSVNKAVKRLSIKQSEVTDSNNPASQKYVFIRTEGRFEKIYLDTILFIEGLKDYVKIYTDISPNPHTTSMNVKTISEKLPPDIFIRVHKSFLVNINKIKSMDTNILTVGNHIVPLGDSYSDAVKKLLLDGKLLKR